MKNIDNKVFGRLIWYLFFVWTVGCIAIFIGPPRSVTLKFCMGMVVACMILGHRLLKAIKDSISLYCKMCFGNIYNDEDND